MVRRVRHGAAMGLIAWLAVADAPVGAQVPPGAGTAVPVAVGSDAAPGELQAWDARLDGMIRTGQLVVVSRTDDPTLADRTHEYAAQFIDGLPVLGAGVARQFDNGATLSAFGTLHEGVNLHTAPAITPAEARVMLERQTGARLADAHTPELSVLPLPTGSYVLAYGAALDDGRYHFASAADGRLVHSLDAVRSQSAIGTGFGILGDRKKVSTLLQGGRYETHDQLRPAEIVTLDVEFDSARYWRLVTPGPWDVRRWTSQDIAADADNDWSHSTAVVDGHVHMGWTYDYFARRHDWEGADGQRGRIIGVVNAYDAYNATAFPPPYGPEGRGALAFGRYRGPEAPDGQPLVALHVVAHELTHNVVFYSVAQRTGSPYGLFDVLIEGESLTLGPRRFTDSEGVTHTCRTATFPVFDYVDGQRVAVEAPALCSDQGRFVLASRQGGAVNEGLADIFAISTGFFHAENGATASYEVGIDVAAGPVRSLSDPRSPGNPRSFDDRIEFVFVCLRYVDGDCYGDFAGVVFIGGRYALTLPGPEGCCYGGQHWNSTILSHAFYLAVEGGTNSATGRSVEGVGPENRALIEDIFFRGLTVHMPAATTLPRAGAVIRQAAADLHPPGSAPYRAVHQALRAAGL